MKSASLMRENERLLQIHLPATTAPHPMPMKAISYTDSIATYRGCVASGASAAKPPPLPVPDDSDPDPPPPKADASMTVFSGSMKYMVELHALITQPKRTSIQRRLNVAVAGVTGGGLASWSAGGGDMMDSCGKSSYERIVDAGWRPEIMMCADLKEQLYFDSPSIGGKNILGICWWFRTRTLLLYMLADVGRSAGGDR